MATQGVVSLVADGHVVLKVIAGSEGMNARFLAERLKSAWPLSIDRAYALASNIPFGSKDSLVVMTSEEVRYHGDGTLDDRYRATFDDPRFNPRWAHGTAAHVEVVEV